MTDLVILVPDKNTQFVLEGLLSRTYALKIKKIDYQIYIHPERDPGVFNRGAEFLRPLRLQFDKALVFLDREGSGQENKTSEEIAQIIKDKAEKFGWQNRVEIIVFDPELEIWAWVKSPHLARNLGWNSLSELKSFISQNGFWDVNHPKPNRPKEAIEIALREKHIPRSSAIYKKIAGAVNFNQCQESSFLKFKQILQNWFPALSE